MCVSIPHRYGKNIFDWNIEIEKVVFPFLIGTVRTYFSGAFSCIKYLFPFLIGTVRTVVAALEGGSTGVFPFLIGTVRTKAMLP